MCIKANTNLLEIIPNCATLQEVMLAVDNELAYQNVKYGTPEQRNLTFNQYLQYLRNELNEVENATEFHDALCELLQTISVGVACLIRYGVEERPTSDLEKLLPELVSK